MLKLSWSEIENLSEELAGKIRASAFEAEYIVGITNGGLIPLYFLAKKLKIRNVLTVSAHSYHKEKQGELTITYLPNADLADKKVLLIDEVAETGITLRKISEAMVWRYRVGDLKTATLLVNKAKCKALPDFYATLYEDEWALFPWEKDDFPEHF